MTGLMELRNQGTTLVIVPHVADEGSTASRAQSGAGQPQQLPALTEEVAIDSIRDFFRDKPFLIFGTGMSCAIDVRFGMAALKVELVQKIGQMTLAAEQDRQWQQVSQSLQGGADLESSLNGVTDSDLLQTITEITGQFVATLDREYAMRIASGDTAWPATNFIKRLVDTLPEGDRILHALTPNYDLLFEYACDSVDAPYTSGFFGGVERKTNWIAVDQSLHVREEVCQRARLVPVFTAANRGRTFSSRTT